jgi:hypothetical protein
MVRPERRVDLAGASPDRVSNAAPGSRLQPEGKIRPSRAECRKPLKEKGANRRDATISERNSLVRLSAERCLGGPSRSFHGEGNIKLRIPPRIPPEPLHDCKHARSERDGRSSFQTTSTCSYEGDRVADGVRDDPDARRRAFSRKMRCRPAAFSAAARAAVSPRTRNLFQRADISR